MTVAERELKKIANPEPIQARLGNGLGNFTEGCEFGKIWVQKREGNGWGKPLQVNQNAARVSYPRNKQISVVLGYDIENELAIIDVPQSGLVNIGYDPGTLNTGNANNSWVKLQSAELLLTMPSQSPDKQLHVKAGNPLTPEYVGVPFPGGSVDLTSEIAALSTGQIQLVLIALKTDGTLTKITNTAKAGPVTLNPITGSDMQACRSQLPPSAIELSAWIIREGMTSINWSDRFADLRGWIMFPQPRNNFSATTTPTVNDDIGDGYGVGSIWVNTSTDIIYHCADNTSTAAVWREMLDTSSTQTLTNKTLTTPTIADFSNAMHSHQNNAGGGTLNASAIAAGTLTHERGGLEADVSAYDGFVKISGGTTSQVTDADLRAILWSVGDYKRSAITADDSNIWLMCDGRTIGDGSSGATARANSDMYLLFLTLWTLASISGNLAIQDSSGGASTYGADFDTDWNAHKRLSLPDFRGRVAAMFDDPPGAAAGAAGRLTGAWADQFWGNSGAETHTLTTSELPSHNHQQQRWTGGGALTREPDAATLGTATTTTTASTLPTTANTGGDGAHNNVQPTIIDGVVLIYTGN